MKTFRLFTLSVASWIALTTLVQAEKKEAPATPAAEEQLVEGVECIHDKDVRKLEVMTKDAGCVAHYTKGGTSSQIGNSRKGVELCRSSIEKVRKNLEAAGYECK